MHQDQLLERMKPGAKSGYKQCDIKVLDQLNKHLATFVPIFNDTAVCRTIICPLMQEIAEMEK